MLDLHCHILPSVDDGAANLDESFAMARFCVDDGITHLVATPHCHRYVHLLKAEIVPRVAELNRELTQAGIPLTILPGSEIQVTDADEYRREFEAGLYCHLGNGTSFTLLEFNWERRQFPADAVGLVRWILARGMTPILAHPERYEFFGREPELLRGLMDAGAWMQVTVDSLLGNHGPYPKDASEALLAAYTEVVLATDAHNRIRCSGMARGYDRVRELFGPERANDLLARGERVLAAISAVDGPRNDPATGDGPPH